MNAKMINIKSGNIVKKAEDLVTARYELGELSIKLMSVLISMLRADDKEFADCYVLRVADWKELSGLSGRSVYENLERAAKELMSNPITIERPHGGFLVVNWLSEAEWVPGSGEMELRIAPKLKPYLLELKSRFLEYGIENILKLKSSYVIRLYELLKHEFRKVSNYNGQKKVLYEIKIGDLRDMFQIPDSYLYANIKAQILDKAQQQLKEKTDIQFTYKEQKKGRAVESIELTIQENNKGSNDFLASEKAFIAHMRKNYVNADIYTAKDKNTSKTLLLSVDANGKLYNKLDMREIDKKRSAELWSALYLLAKHDKLFCLKQGTLF